MNRRNIGEALDLQEYIFYLDSCVDMTSRESVQASYKELQRLAMNESFLESFIDRSLRDYQNYQLNNVHSVQSIILHQCDSYTLRANFWPADFEYNMEESEVDKYFAYDHMHDHNFDFMTVGYKGNGYETILFSRKLNDNLEEGEEVEVDYLGRRKLGVGDCFYFESGKHIHSQFRPSDFSVSINLIPHQLARKRNQFEFTLKSGLNTVIVKSKIKEMSYFSELKVIINSLGDDEAKKLLKDFC